MAYIAFGLLAADFDIMITWHVHGYIRSPLRHIVIPNKSTLVVHGKFLQLLVNVNEIGLYSWGLACLAMLYRGLDRFMHRVEGNSRLHGIIASMGVASTPVVGFFVD